VGLPRATLDIGLTLWVPGDNLDRVCGSLCARYHPRVADPRKFVGKTRVLSVTTNTGVRIDFLFAAFAFEKEMVERAPLRQLGGVTVRVATLEDLILLKLPSSRGRDQEDVRLILGAHGERLQWDYLLSVADSLAEALDQPDWDLSSVNIAVQNDPWSYLLAGRHRRQRRTGSLARKS